MTGTLKSKIKSVLDRYGHNQNDLAELLGITYQSISLKINRKNDFTYREVYKFVHAYNLSPEETYDIFFSIDTKVNDNND